MQRDHALQVALKDRPKVFQAVVLCLFSFCVLTVIFSLAYSFQEKKHAVNKPNAKQALVHGFQASLPSTANR